MMRKILLVLSLLYFIGCGENNKVQVDGCVLGAIQTDESRYTVRLMHASLKPLDAKELKHMRLNDDNSISVVCSDSSCVTLVPGDRVTIGCKDASRRYWQHCGVWNIRGKCPDSQAPGAQ